MAIWAVAVLCLIILIITLLAVIAVRTAVFKSKQIRVPTGVVYPVDLDEAAGRLSSAIGFKTVSSLDQSQVDYGELTRFQAFLEKSFPLVHATLKKDTINKYGLLYVWQGSDTGKKPVLLLAHQDVVPAWDEGWTHPPFSGAIADNYIWGRGTMDDKGTLMSILEAIEFLLKEGYKPSRSVYLASGFDEEVGGREGAGKIAECLRTQGIQFEFVLDEGMVATNGVVPGIPGWVALIGTAEKGYLTLELTAEGKGGHASQPPRETAVGILAAAINKLQNNPFPTRMTTPTSGLFEYLGPEMRGLNKMIFANMWLLGPVVKAKLSSNPTTNASVRTTIAPTMFQGSQQDNILPMLARATINCRILQGESIKSVTDRVQEVIKDPRVKITPVTLSSFEPSPVSPTTGWSFHTLMQTVREIMPDALVTPMLVLGRTDCTYFTGLSPCCYRFVPQRVPAAEMTAIHGINERISINNYGEMICFYIRLIQNSSTDLLK
jgi:carboxypeptidase PM20D1